MGNNSSKAVNVGCTEELKTLFTNGINKKAIMLLDHFPYMVIGKIQKVIADSVQINVETSNVSEFENKRWYVNIHSIQTFYIEESGKCKIPSL